MEKFTPEEAQQECPVANDCRYAEIGSCTLADIHQNCALYHDLIQKVEKNHLTEEMDKFKGFCSGD